MKFKKKLGYVSKTFLASMVIFNLVITTAAVPVVSLAYEGEESRDASAPATQSEDKGDTGKEQKGDEGDKGETGQDDDDRTNPGKPQTDTDKPDTSSKEDKGSSSSRSGSRPNKGEVKGEETASCDEGNLIVNGGFEQPVVTHSSDWNIYPDGTSGLGWHVEWRDDFAGTPSTANLEIQSGVNGWDAYTGGQYAELDSDWGGPNDAGNGEAASTLISQTFPTTPGNTYALTFAFAARPGTSDAENRLGIYIDGGAYDLSPIADGLGLTDVVWMTRGGYEFTAVDTSTTIGFADLGAPNSIGTFIDDIRVNCVREGGEGCPADQMIYARVKLAKQPYGWRNWGNGNTSGKTFVGGNAASNVYMSGEWFPLTNADGTFIEDPSMEAGNYDDVPGLALERSAGSVRIVLYGFLYDDSRINGAGITSTRPATAQIQSSQAQPDKAGTPLVRNYYLLNRELSQGSLEFSTDMINRSTTVIPTSQVSDPVNPLDHVAGVNQYHPGSDATGIVYNLSQWHMLVTTGSDGFYTYYTYPTTTGDKDDCGNDGDKTGTLVVNKVIRGKADGSFSFNGPNGVFSITTSGGEGSATISDVAVGTYNVTEAPEEAWHVVSSTCGAVEVIEDMTVECTIVNERSDDGQDPGFDVSDACILFGTDFPMDRIVITGDAEGELDHSNIFIFDLNTFHGDIAGDYPLTITLKDDEGNVLAGPTLYIFTVAAEGADDCDDGNGGDNVPPTITSPESVCILTSATQQTYNFLKDVVASDADGDAVTIYYSHNIVFGEVGGPFTITYSAIAGDDTTTDTTIVNIKENCDGGTGGGDDDNPTLTVPGDICLVKGSVEAFDYLAGVSAVDFTGDAIVLDTEGEDANLVIVGTVNVGENGAYPLVYTVTDIFGSDQAGRTITVDDDCDNGGGGDGCDEGEDCDNDCDSDEDCDNGGGGGSSSGSRGGRNRGEVLGAESCVAFSEYHDTGDQGGEIRALQTFLNEYMDAGLTVDGIYDRATTQAVHDFQAMHWDDIIDPWTPPLSANTTGREYKTTRATINAIIECPEMPVYLEDPMTMFSITEVKNKKAFSQSQIDKVTELLLEAQGAASAADAK